MYLSGKRNNKSDGVKIPISLSDCNRFAPMPFISDNSNIIYCNGIKPYNKAAKLCYTVLLFERNYKVIKRLTAVMHVNIA